MQKGRPDHHLTRRRIVLAFAASVGLAGVAGARFIQSGVPPKPPKPAPDVFEQVAPRAGVNTGVTFGDSLPKLITAGALVPEKLPALGGRLPGWVQRALRGNWDEPIIFSRDQARYVVNLLWPLGLSNRVVFNRRSPINTDRLAGFASTGGWTLGREPNGAAYFDSIDAVRLSDRQTFLALAIATNTFRPCCDNSTFFQDCNHGSALLGLMELAVAQGATAEAIYRLALTANAYWFPREICPDGAVLRAVCEPFMAERIGVAGPRRRVFLSQRLAAERGCPAAASRHRGAGRPERRTGVRHLTPVFRV